MYKTARLLLQPMDILSNLPFVQGCYLSFDHHSSEVLRNAKSSDSRILVADAPSTARVIYDHYGAEKFPRVPVELMEAVDKADSGQISEADAENPTGWALLNFLMDSRTGLGRFRGFRTSNYQLMLELIDYCRDHTVDEILSLPDVKERVDLYAKYNKKAKQQLMDCSTIHGNLVVLDMRNEAVIYPINRFAIYLLSPGVNISIHVLKGLKNQNTVFAIGKSVINRTSDVNIGELCLKYGGGGHLSAGSCQVEHERAEEVLSEIKKYIKNVG